MGAEQFEQPFSEFEPRIVAFCCNWCSYAGADLAGVSRYQYPPGVRIVRVMCSGRVEPVFIFDAFKNGADGVLVTGCHPGDCHYVSGNLNAERRVENTRKALEYLGLGAGRLRLNWISASEGLKFAEVMRGFTEEIKELGPSPIKSRVGVKNPKS
jgi:F420-non-reducing hydrogenase iron-sulfur subunit